MAIDLNADLGESFGAWRMGDDLAMLDLVTSANVACGFHGGDPQVLLATCEAAAQRGVVVGAHVSYRDLAGFGRDFIDVAPQRLRAEVLYQIGAIDLAARVTGARLGYLKPHGALYHALNTHPEQADAVVSAMVAVNAVRAEPLMLLCQPGHGAEAATAAGIEVVIEAFADRGIRPDGTLVPRGQPGALITDATQAAERVVHLARTGQLTADDGSLIAVPARSICVHGDTPGAVEMARQVRAGLRDADVTVAAFA